MRLQLIGAAITILIYAAACTHGASDGSSAGSEPMPHGLSPTSPSVDLPVPAAVPAGKPQRSVGEMLAVRTKAGQSLAPTDPAVLACVGRPYANWAALAACLHDAPPPEVPKDAGHRYGAVRIPPVCAAQSVPTWYFSPSGSDDNTCVSSGSPCQHYREIASRWGCGGPPVTDPVHSSLVQLVFLGSQPDGTDRVIYQPILNNGGFGYVTGTWTMLATGTLSSVSPRSLTAADPRLKADLGAAASGHLSGHGLLLVNTTRASSVAAVQEVITGTQVAISQPFVSNAPGPPTAPVVVPAEHNDWANGDTWQLWQLPNVYLSEISAAAFAQSESEGVFVSHINVPDESGTGASGLSIGDAVQMTEVTSQVFISSNGRVNAPTFTNVLNENSASLQSSIWIGGAIEAGGVQLIGSALDGDVIIHGTSGISQADIDCTSPGVPILSAIQMVGGVQIIADSTTAVTPFNNLSGYGGGADLYGTYTLQTVPGTSVTYDFGSTAPLVFQGVPSLTLDDASTGLALDVSHSPVHYFGGISITPANVALAVASGGFGGIAYGYAGSVLAPSAPSVSPSNSPYFVAGTGISLSGGGPGQALTISNSSPGGGGVTSFTASTGLSCSGSTGAISCSNSGVLTIAGGTNVTCSPTTGNAICSFTGVLPASLGGTGAAAPIAHELAVAEGSSAFNFVSVGGTGQVLTQVTAAADPVFANVDLSGTNTSLANSLPHTRGGTDVTSPGASGNVLRSNGTNWTSAAPVIGSMLGYNASSVSAMNGTTFVTIASFTATTPNDGITHTYRVHGDFNVQNTNNGAWDVLCGVAQNSTTVLLVPSLQMLIETPASFTWFSAGSVTATTTAPPNTSETFSTMCNLNTAGSTGISVNANVDALIVN